MNANRMAHPEQPQGTPQDGRQGSTQEGLQGELSGVLLSQQSVRQMRRNLHELANTLTGVMIAGGLLTQYLDGGSLAGYAADVCEAAERGSQLVRELRGYLLAACGEADIRGGVPKAEPEHGEITEQ